MFTAPSRSVSFDSPLSRSAIIESIDPHVHPLDELGPVQRRSSFRTYEGHLTADGFILRRILKRGANSFIPKVNVTLRERPSGTELTMYAELSLITRRMIMIMRIFFLLFLAVLLIWGDPFSRPTGIFILGIGLFILFAT